MQQGKFVDPMSAASTAFSAVQGDIMKAVMTMPVIGALAGGYAGYYGMIPYVRDFT